MSLGFKSLNHNLTSVHKHRSPERNGEKNLFLRWRVISYGSSVRNLLLVTLQAPRILMLLPNFLKISAFQLYIKFKHRYLFYKNKGILDTKVKVVKTANFKCCNMHIGQYI